MRWLDKIAKFASDIDQAADHHAACIAHDRVGRAERLRALDHAELAKKAQDFCKTPELARAYEAAHAKYTVLMKGAK